VVAAITSQVPAALDEDEILLSGQRIGSGRFAQAVNHQTWQNIYDSPGSDSKEAWQYWRGNVGKRSTEISGIDAMKSELEKVTKAWPPISRAVRVPHTEADYRDLVELLDRITDEVGEDENHPLASLMDVLGVLIEKYEDEHVPELID